MPKWNQLWKIALRQCSEAGVWSVISRWCFVEVMKLGLVNILNLKFSRDGDVWLRFWRKCFVQILKMKFDQDLCLNLWYDPIGYFGKMNSTLGSVVPLAMFSMHFSLMLIFIINIIIISIVIIFSFQLFLGHPVHGRQYLETSLI